MDNLLVPSENPEVPVVVISILKKCAH